MTGARRHGNGRELNGVWREIKACRICRDAARGTPLPHEPRPVLRPSATARLCIASQAPGVRVHASGIPFSDASGDRLRTWLALTPAEFYDTRRVAIVPMVEAVPIVLQCPGDGADEATSSTNSS